MTEDLFSGERRSPAPAVLEPLPTGLVRFESAEAMAAHAATLLAPGEDPRLSPAAASGYGYETFPILVLRTHADDYVCALATDLDPAAVMALLHSARQEKAA